MANPKQIRPMSEGDPTSDIQEDPYRKKQKNSLMRWVRESSVMLLLSITLHLFILFMISLIPAEERDREVETTIITAFTEEDEVKEEMVEIEKIELDTKEVEIQDVKINVTEAEEVVEIEEPMEALEDNSLSELMDLIPMETDNTNISSLAVIGLSGGAAGSSGLPTGYGNRGGKGKASAIRRNGGGAKSEAAVEAALRWLAEHQEDDGHWEAKKYEGETHATLATTGIALLPFLGAGHNELAGKYKNVVRRGINYINQEMGKIDVKCKRDSNGFSRNEPLFHDAYGRSIVLMALSESSIFGSSPLTKKHANLLAEDFLDMYERLPGKGWGYTSGGSDLSVSGWVALGLKSGKAADLKAMHDPRALDIFNQYKRWIDEDMTLPETGEAYYRGKDKTMQSMSWVAMFQKQFLGFPRSDPFLSNASTMTQQILEKSPNIFFKADQPGDIYIIYYGTLASFQQQGMLWDSWNPKMLKCLLGSQRTGNPKEFGGSWDPTVGHTSKHGGRIFSTAMLALCLEIYYRYDIMN